MDYFDWHEEPGTTGTSPGTSRPTRGCSTSVAAGWIAKHFADYTGIDGSPDAVAKAGDLDRNVILGDVDQPLPFADSTFDAMVVKDFLEHVQNPGVVVGEALRVLRPGGLLFASSPDAQRWVWDDYTHVRPFTIRGFRRLFLDQRLEGVASGHESVMPGTSIVSARTRAKRRPLPYRVAAKTRLTRRNVWLLARAPIG